MAQAFRSRVRARPPALAMAGKPLPADLKKQIQKSLIKSTDMTGEQSGEVRLIAKDTNE